MNTAMHPREPLSWLLLERYALEELTPEERARVAERLAESAEDRALLDSIMSDVSELPPLPELPVGTLPPVIDLTAARSRRRGWLGVSTALLAAAAALLLYARAEQLPASRRHVSDGVKGGEVALVLHGEESGAEATTFAQGERFKLLLTCPSWLSTQLRVVVFQSGQRFEPLTRVPVFACGNHVPWPGAFALDGHEPVDVCVSFGGVGQTQAARSPRELAPPVVCTRLSPR